MRVNAGDWPRPPRLPTHLTIGRAPARQATRPARHRAFGQVRRRVPAREVVALAGQVPEEAVGRTNIQKSKSRRVS